MSDTTYSLDCHPFAYGNRPFYRDSLIPDHGVCTSGGTGFADEILEIADPYINYADFDKDNNGVVDGFFFIIISPSTETGGCPIVDCNYLSNDTLADGERVLVDGYYGVEIRIYGDSNDNFSGGDYFKHFCVHEWGHQFGLNDLYCYSGNSRSIGFSAMGNDHFENRCSPYDPYSRAKLGWVEPTVVSGTLTDQPIADHMSTGEVYQLYCPGYTSHYFLVSNHYKLPEPDYWEAYFPGRGLLIWHITPEGDNTTLGEIREVDVEGADSLFDYTQTPPVPDDSMGMDSIDLGCLGKYHTFWNENTQIDFDDNSNPNTRDYIKQDSIFKQTLYTGVWVRNIEGEGGDTMWADLFSPSIRWGPGDVHLSGDYVVDSGYTLAIFPGTDIIFDTTDDQSSGYDTTRCELIVKGNLVARGLEPDSEPPPPPTKGPKNVQFKSSSDSAQPGDWYGIVVDSGGSAHLEVVEIKDAYCGVSFNYTSDPSNKVKNCAFSGNQLYGIKSKSSKVEVFRNYVTAPSAGYGIYVENLWADVRENIIDSADYGIYIKGGGGGSVTMNENEINGPGYRGLHIQDISVPFPPVPTPLNQNKVAGQFSDCHLYLNDANLVQVNSCSFLTGDTIGSPSRSPTGIKAINSGNVKVRETSIIDYRSSGFVAYSQTTADLGVHSEDPGNNYIATNSVLSPPRRVYAVVNWNTDTLKAEDNYWGTDDPPDTMFSGPVDYNPWLSSPPGQGKIHVAQNDNRPKEYTLWQNYPNPFNPNTIIRFTLPKASRVSMKIYNIMGQLVKEVLDEELPSGVHTVTWSGDNESGKEVASGIYFYVVKAGDFRAAKKMVLLR